MTKKVTTRWLIGVSAFAMLATTGVGVTGYLTKGFTQWKANENTTEKVEESSNDSSTLIYDDSTVPEESSEEADEFNPANKKSALRHVLKANTTSMPLIDYSNYKTWESNYFQVDDQLDRNLPNEAIPASMNNTYVALVVVIDRDFNDYFNPNKPVQNCNEQGIEYLKIGENECLFWGDMQTMANHSNWIGFMIDTQFDYTVYYKGYEAEELNHLINGSTKDIFIDVDKNYSKDTIISSIKAKDLFGVECTVTVTSGLDTFTPATIGVYTLKLKATDSYGQTATATLIVHICDYVAPVITQAKPLTFTADKNQTLKFADLPSYISVTDNGTSHGSNLTIVYKYDGTVMSNTWSKTFTAADYGSHTISVNAKDSTGNEKSATLTLKVNDGTAPVFTRTDGAAIGSKITIGVSKTFNMTLADVTQLFKATDNVDGDVSNTITGLTDKDKKFFTTNHKVGSYTLTICATDKNSNQVTQAIPVEIVADIPPVFIIADTLVYTDTANPLSVAQLNLVVSNGILANKNISSLSVDASEYIGHETEPGTYHVDYEYTTA
ncbi:MAG: hypothetical protein K6G09_01545, partial [Treponema sp.]|nr:hypothetical protein [Treponema sp.]